MKAAIAALIAAVICTAAPGAAASVAPLPERIVAEGEAAQALAKRYGHFDWRGVVAARETRHYDNRWLAYTFLSRPVRSTADDRLCLIRVRSVTRTPDAGANVSPEPPEPKAAYFSGGTDRFLSAAPSGCPDKADWDDGFTARSEGEASAALNMLKQVAQTIREQPSSLACFPRNACPPEAAAVLDPRFLTRVSLRDCKAATACFFLTFQTPRQAPFHGVTWSLDVPLTPVPAPYRFSPAPSF